MTVSCDPVPIAAVEASHSGLVRCALNFCHRPSHRLREVEEGEEEGGQEHRAESDEAVGTHGLVHVGPNDDDYKIERPVHLTGYTHCRLHVPMDIKQNFPGRVKSKD